MSLEVDGIEDVINFGEGLTNTMPERFATYLEKAVLETLDLARSNLQNNRNVNTGTLLASLRILSIEKEGLEITFGTTLEYAKYIEYGRGPVDARDHKHPLSWIDKDTGKRIFAMHVGPVNPMPFFDPAVIAISQKYSQIVINGETSFVGSLR